MKKLAICFVLSAIALFADVTGKWSGTGKASTSDGDTQTLPLTLDLKQTGNEVTGTVINGESAEHYSIKNGTLDGDTLKLEVVANESTYGITLKVAGDEMTGEATADHGGEAVKVKLVFKRES